MNTHLKTYLRESERKHIEERIKFYCGQPEDFLLLVDEIKKIVVDRMVAGRNHSDCTIASMTRTYIRKYLRDLPDFPKCITLMGYLDEYATKERAKRQRATKKAAQRWKDESEEETEEEEEEEQATPEVKRLRLAPPENKEAPKEEEQTVPLEEEQAVPLEEEQAVPLEEEQTVAPAVSFLSFVEMQTAFVMMQRSVVHLHKMNSDLKDSLDELTKRMAESEKSNTAMKKTLEKYIGLKIE